MVQMMATPDQIRLLSEASGDIEIVDGSGNRLGLVHPLFTAEEIAEARQRSRSSEERRTTAQVLERLQASPPQ